MNSTAYGGKMTTPKPRTRRRTEKKAVALLDKESGLSRTERLKAIARIRIASQPVVEAKRIIAAAHRRKVRCALGRDANPPPCPQYA